jgi:hypothetical protein
MLAICTKSVVLFVRAYIAALHSCKNRYGSENRSGLFGERQK